MLKMQYNPSDTQHRAQSDLLSLDAPFYVVDKKLAGWGRLVNVVYLGSINIPQAVHLLRRNLAGIDVDMPSRSKAAELATAFANASASAASEWDGVVRSAFMTIHGRDYRITDYKVSGIARDEFPDDVKEQLRKLSAQRTVALILARVWQHWARYGRANK